MNFSVVFQNSGDSIPFQTISTTTADVLVYYVENLNNCNSNKFSSGIGGNIKSTVDKLHSTIVKCNDFVYELVDQYIDTYTEEEYLEQKNLNKLHADWVNFHNISYNILKKKSQYGSEQSEHIHTMFPDSIPEPPIGTIIDKLGMSNLFGDINLSIHQVEALFRNARFSTAEWIEMPNIFTKSILSNSICNFSLPFNHLGRSLYDKFLDFDHNLEFDDENSFNELVGLVTIKLMPPQTILLSSEYVEWCREHNRVPCGNNLNIGNIPDLNKRLTDYRKIIFRNTLQNNNFSIQLNKGN
jgi:hypothetical protein